MIKYGFEQLDLYRIYATRLGHNPASNIEIYTTEPTFVLDLAAVFPAY